MVKNNQKTKPGFTIIEVVLVLAIAGLIFLMVFLALPALQRSQRDTQRRDDLAGFATQITNYQANNRGRLPENKVASWNSFLENYMKQAPTPNSSAQEGAGEFIDPDGTNYYITGNSICTLEDTKCKESSGGAFLTNNELDSSNKKFSHIIYIVYGAKCDGEKVVPVTGTASRQIAFLYKLEGGGVYCNSTS